MGLNNKYAVVVLAAGSSKRLGHAKQLVPFRNTNLLDHTLMQIRQSCLQDVFLVLGHNAEAILDGLNSEAIHNEYSVLINPHYHRGMGNTMSFALSKIVEYNYDAVLFCLCDQAYLGFDIIDQMISKFERGKEGIIICKYKNDALGPPSLFSSRYFEDIQKLRGDIGAKLIVAEHSADLGLVHFPDGDIDIDTPDDLAELI